MAHVSSHSNHHQVYTDFTFIGKCNHIKLPSQYYYNCPLWSSPVTYISNSLYLQIIVHAGLSQLFPSGEGREFQSVSAESGSCGVGSCEAESEVHGTAPLLSRFLSGDVKSVSKKWFLHTNFTYRFLASSILQGWPIFWDHNWAL